MKILYVITGLGQGGAERVVCDLANSMFEKGHDIKIAYLTGDVSTKPMHSEIELININLNGLMALPSAYQKLSKIIKNYQPDVVHAHMIHANIFTRLVRIITPIKKLICTAHSANEGGRLRMVLYRMTHPLSDITTNVSNIASNAYIERKAVPKNGIITVYNGVNFNNFKYSNLARLSVETELDLDSSTKIILAVGRFHYAKNYPNLLSAIKILKNKYPLSFKLLIAGDGELRVEIEQLIDQLDLNNEVVLLGRRNDIPKLMSACDVFVLSSAYEGLPTVLIEAMACQAQVVSTDVSGAEEILKDNGEIVNVNDPEQLAQSIVLLLERNEKNKAGYEYVYNKFNLNMISDQWLDIYYEKY